MTTYEKIMIAIETIKTNWGVCGEEVIGEAFKEHKKITLDDFLDYCIACGGNWIAMTLSGIKALYPNTYESIPNTLGVNSVDTLVSVLYLCGVEY